MFMNSNSLPIALMQSLVVTVSALRWDQDDEADAMLGRALTYLVLFSTLGMVLRWSYGVSLLAKSDEPDRQDPAYHDVERAPQPDINIVVHGPETNYGALNDARSDSDSEESNSISDTGRKDGNVVPNPYKQSHSSYASTSSSLPHLPPTSSSEAGPHTPESSSIPAKKSIFAPLKRAWHAINGFMTPPLWAALLSLVVACVQPLQHFLDQHFPPVKGALSAAGSCSVPVTMVVLGAYFYNSGSNDAGKSCSKPDRVGVGASAISAPSATGHGDEEAVDERTPLCPKGPGRRVHKERSTATLASVPSTKSIVSFFQGAFRSKQPKRGAVYLEGDEEAGRSARTSAETSDDESDDAHALSASHDRDATAVEWEPPASWKQIETPDNVDRRGEGRTVLVAVLSRMVLVPLVLIPLFALAVQWDAHELLDDPVFIVSTILLIASPPAITLAQITQAASSDAFERLVSRTIFWSYCIVTPPTTIVVVIVGLLIAGLA